MALRNWLEETWADVNPFDGGKTGASVRGARAAKPAPARTPKANTARPQMQNQAQTINPQQPQSRISKIDIPTLGVTSAAPQKPLTVSPSPLQLPSQKPLQVKEAKPQALAAPAPKAPLPDEDFTKIGLSNPQNKKIFGADVGQYMGKFGKTYTPNADQTTKTNKDKYVAEFDRMKPEFRNYLVNQAKEKAAKGDKAAQNTVRALTDSGRMKGDIADFVEGSNERFLGGLSRAALRTADFVIPGENSFGLNKMADNMDASKLGTRQYTNAGKAGEVTGDSQKIATDVASMVVPAAAAEKAIRATKLVSGMAQGSKLAKFGAYTMSNVGGGLPASVIQAGQQIGNGEDPDIAKAVAIGAGADLVAPAIIKPVVKGLSKMAGFAAKKLPTQAPTPVDTPSLQPLEQATPAPRVPEAPVAPIVKEDPTAEIAQLEDHLRKHGNDGNYSQDNFMAETRLAELKQNQVDEFVSGRTERIPLKEGEKYSRFANRTLQGSDEVSDAQKKLMRDEQVTYDAVTDAARAENATALIDSLPKEKAFGRVIKDLENPKAMDGGQKEFNAIELAKRLDGEADEDSLAMSTEIYRKLSENASKRGQEIQALAYLNNRTPQGLLYGAVRDIDKAGVKVTPEIKQQIKAFTDEISKHPVGSEARNFAVYQLSQFVTKQIPVGIAPKIVNFWRAGLLTAPTTTGGNIMGNTGEALVRKGFVDPVADLSDRVMSVFTGKRAYASNGGFVQGAKEGTSKLKPFMKTGYDERNALSKYDSGELNYGDGKVGTAIGKYVNGTYRLMSLADQPFWYGARNEALANLAKVDAINKGLKGKDLDAHVNNILDNPPNSLMEQATKEAKYATFQNETMLGSVAGAIKQGAERYAGDKGRAIMDFFIPFTQVPASIATRVVQRTPVGTGAEIVKQILNTRKGIPFDQRSMAKAIGEGSFGSAVFAGGYALANSDMLTFGFPDDPKERELWEQEGKQPYSVKFGDRWYSLNYLQPFGTLLAVGGEAAKAVKEGADPTSMISRASATAAQAVMNQSFLKGISGVLDAIDDPKRYAENYAENTAGSILPNFIRSFARAADGTQRDAHGLMEGIQAGIPGARNMLDAKQDSFGQDLPAKDSFVNQYLNPLRPSKVRGDDVTAELRRLQDAGVGIMPTNAKKDAFEGTTLDRKQISEINRRAGLAMKNEYATLIGSEDYQAMSDEQKADSLKKINDTVFGAIKHQYAQENGIATTTELDKSQKRYLEGRNVNFLSKKKADGTAADGIEIADGLSDAHREVLGDYDVMTTEERESWFSEVPDAEYKYELAKANNKAALGTLSKAEKQNLKTSLAKSKVGSAFKKETRDLYGLSKAELWDLVSNDPDGQKLADDVVAYGDALAEAGLGKNKFRNSKGGLAIEPSSGGSGSRGGGKGNKSGKKLDYKMAGYIDASTTGKSLRQLLKEAQISKAPKRPA